MINIKLNGESFTLKGQTINDLLRESSCQEEKIAIEVNREIIAKEDFTTTSLKSGDEVELVEFVGGG